MWIIPKNLHTSAYVQDMAALTSDLSELSTMCEQSLMWRSKPSNVRTWSQRWKRGGWMQLLSGRILRPSHGQIFVEKWTSSLVASHVNLSPQQDEEEETKTPATYGHISSKESSLPDLPLFSWRMLKASSVQNSKATNGATHKELQFCFMSSESWKDWVIKQRREYSQRLKLARHTKEEECSSWDTVPMLINPTLNGKSQHVIFSPVERDKSNMSLSRPELQWTTPLAGDYRLNGASLQTIEKRQAKKKQISLYGEVLLDSINWSTPTLSDVKDKGLKRVTIRKATGQKRLNLLAQQVLYQEKYAGKLNPRWVDCMMGLPIGWTCPTSTQLVKIQLMNFVALEMELYPKPQQKHFSPCQTSFQTEETK